MDEPKFVPIDVFAGTCADQLAVIQQLMTIVYALSEIIQQSGIVTPEAFTQHIENASKNEGVQAVRNAIAQLQGKRSIEDILKGFNGPPQ